MDLIRDLGMLCRDLREGTKLFFTKYLAPIGAQSFGWLTIVLLHLAPVPTLIAVLLGHSDKMPPVDLMIFVWGALVAYFFKSLINRNHLYTATICLGFAAQVILMGLILFK